MAEDCIFCDIVQGKKAAQFILAEERVVAFNDMHPGAPVHVLIVPRKHIRSINDLEEEDGPLLAEMIFTARGLAGELGVSSSGYKLLFNVERGGGQHIFHIHLHLLGGW